MLEKAIQIALTAHRGQIDRGGELYILHPIRVMIAQKTTTEKICAILHDVVEDTEVTLDYLSREGFTHEMLVAIEALTKQDGEAYEDYIGRITLNRIAMKVKLADLKDNMDLSRIKHSDPADNFRQIKYEKAKKKILDVLQNGEIDDCEDTQREAY
jgi:(p)ppGpp synthase/HD superfamily hydrolase